MTTTISKNIVLDHPDETVIAKCDRLKKIYSNWLESEEKLENTLINLLKNEGYEYDDRIKGEKELKNNLKVQLEKLNSTYHNKPFSFSNSEWDLFYKEVFEKTKNTGVENRARKIQRTECYEELKRDDKQDIFNVFLFDRKNPNNNYLQVINQFESEGRKNRYDVTILVNGLPLVHIELKRAGNNIEDAFKQINAYKKDAFKGLFEFIQIFVISNGIQTRYYANTTKKNDLKSSFRLTSRWGYAKDKTPIDDIFIFVKTFLSKKVLLEVLAKYCVLDGRGVLMILRHYQIAAIEKITERIKRSIDEPDKYKEIKAGGYIWNTPGSGKTLTSYKAAKLAANIPGIEKVLFLVDRKDLDVQTLDDWMNFQGENADYCINVDTAHDTKELTKFLNDGKKRIIVSSIQKLKRMSDPRNKKKYKSEEKLWNKKIVMMADECHRSYSTENTREVINRFKGRNLFGFTGTPLREMKEDKSINDDTKDTFGKCLQEYKIIDAIKDENVLPWIVATIDLENKSKIVEHIIKSFKKWTWDRHFNSMMTVNNIWEVIEYYQEFKKQQEYIEEEKRLKIVMIFSPSNDYDEGDCDEKKSEELKKAIKDYNEMFGTSIEKFDEYRDDISRRMKNKKQVLNKDHKNSIDILLVVNMFLTGFNSEALNTLWINRDLKGHGLIQTISRTNRVFYGKKTGNIVCFKNLRDKIRNALILYAVSSEEDLDEVIINTNSKMQKCLELEDTILNKWSDPKKIPNNTELEFIRTWKKFTNSKPFLIESDDFKKNRKMTEEAERLYKEKFLELQEKHKKTQAKEEYKKDEPTLVEDDDVIHIDEINAETLQHLLDEYYRTINENSSEEIQEKLRKQILSDVSSSSMCYKEKSIIEKYLRSHIYEKGGLKYEDYKEEEFWKTIDELAKRYSLNAEGLKKWCKVWRETKDINLRIDTATRDIMPPVDLTLVENITLHKERLNTIKQELLDIFYKFDFLDSYQW